MKIDWDADVQLTDEVRQALHPQDPAHLRAGRLRRPFHVKPRRPAGRARLPAGKEILHPKGALVFAFADDQWCLVEAPEDS
jgi:hypothetical protein